MILRVVLYIAASLLLAAHFLREGSLMLVAVSVLVPLLFVVRRPWSLVALQVAAYVASAIWIITAVALVQERLAMGRPWKLAVLILGAVAVLTAIAGALLNSRVVKERYRAPG